jgi:hypothetical protein
MAQDIGLVQAIDSLLGTDSREIIIITQGCSKEDHRMDCKEVVQELLVSSDGDALLMMKACSGSGFCGGLSPGSLCFWHSGLGTGAATLCCG